jgi:Helix-turn-helix domain
VAGWKGLRAVPPLEWMRAVRDGIDLSKSVKSVAFCLALHANSETSETYPGWKRLAWESGASRRTVISALRELEGVGLLYCVERGSSFGTRNKASKYLLTLHDDLAVITTTYEAWLKNENLMSPADFIHSVAPNAPEDPWGPLSTTGR